MKFILSILAGLFLTAFSPVNAQDMTGSLTVYGEAFTNIQPDEVLTRFHTEAKNMDYQRTVDLLGERSDQLLKTLRKLGYEPNDLKTSQFNVSKNYEYSNGIRKDSGYVASQILQLKFSYQPDDLIKLINAVSGSSADPQISFSFQLSDQKMKQVKENLISEAVMDARRKADIITDASGTDIYGIKEIKYGNLTGSGPPMYRMMEKASGSEPAYGGFNAEDLSFSESIEITYMIR